MEIPEELENVMRKERKRREEEQAKKPIVISRAEIEEEEQEGIGGVLTTEEFTEEDILEEARAREEEEKEKEEMRKGEKSNFYAVEDDFLDPRTFRNESSDSLIETNVHNNSSFLADLVKLEIDVFTKLMIRYYDAIFELCAKILTNQQYDFNSDIIPIAVAFNNAVNLLFIIRDLEGVQIEEKTIEIGTAFLEFIREHSNMYIRFIINLKTNPNNITNDLLEELKKIITNDKNPNSIFSILTRISNNAKEVKFAKDSKYLKSMGLTNVTVPQSELDDVKYNIDVMRVLTKWVGVDTLFISSLQELYNEPQQYISIQKKITNSKIVFELGRILDVEAIIHNSETKRQERYRNEQLLMQKIEKNPNIVKIIMDRFDPNILSDRYISYLEIKKSDYLSSGDEHPLGVFIKKDMFIDRNIEIGHYRGKVYLQSLSRPNKKNLWFAIIELDFEYEGITHVIWVDGNIQANIEPGSESKVIEPTIGYWASLSNHKWVFPLSYEYMDASLNRYFSNIEVNGDGTVVSLREISNEEEIFLDYGTDYWDTTGVDPIWDIRGIDIEVIPEEALPNIAYYISISNVKADPGTIERINLLSEAYKKECGDLTELIGNPVSGNPISNNGASIVTPEYVKNQAKGIRDNSELISSSVAASTITDPINTPLELIDAITKPKKTKKIQQLKESTLYYTGIINAVRSDIFLPPIPQSLFDKRQQIYDQTIREKKKENERLHNEVLARFLEKYPEYKNIPHFDYEMMLKEQRDKDFLEGEESVVLKEVREKKKKQKKQKKQTVIKKTSVVPKSPVSTPTKLSPSPKIPVSSPTKPSEIFLPPSPITSPSPVKPKRRITPQSLSPLIETQKKTVPSTTLEPVIPEVILPDIQDKMEIEGEEEVIVQRMSEMDFNKPEKVVVDIVQQQVEYSKKLEYVENLIVNSTVKYKKILISELSSQQMMDYIFVRDELHKYMIEICLFIKNKDVLPPLLIDRYNKIEKNISNELREELKTITKKEAYLSIMTDNFSYIRSFCSSLQFILVFFYQDSELLLDLSNNYTKMSDNAEKQGNKLKSIAFLRDAERLGNLYDFFKDWKFQLNTIIANTNDQFYSGRLSYELQFQLLRFLKTVSDIMAICLSNTNYNAVTVEDTNVYSLIKSISEPLFANIRVAIVKDLIELEAESIQTPTKPKELPIGTVITKKKKTKLPKNIQPTSEIITPEKIQIESEIITPQQYLPIPSPEGPIATSTPLRSKTQPVAPILSPIKATSPIPKPIQESRSIIETSKDLDEINAANLNVTIFDLYGTARQNSKTQLLYPVTSQPNRLINRDNVNVEKPILLSIEQMKTVTALENFYKEESFQETGINVITTKFYSGIINVVKKMITHTEFGMNSALLDFGFGNGTFAFVCNTVLNLNITSIDWNEERNNKFNNTAIEMWKKNWNTLPIKYNYVVDIATQKLDDFTHIYIQPRYSDKNEFTSKIWKNIAENFNDSIIARYLICCIEPKFIKEVGFNVNLLKITNEGFLRLPYSRESNEYYKKLYFYRKIETSKKLSTTVKTKKRLREQEIGIEARLERESSFTRKNDAILPSSPNSITQSNVVVSPTKNLTKPVKKRKVTSGTVVPTDNPIDLQIGNPNEIRPRTTAELQTRAMQELVSKNFPPGKISLKRIVGKISDVFESAIVKSLNNEERLLQEEREGIIKRTSDPKKISNNNVNKEETRQIAISKRRREIVFLLLVVRLLEVKGKKDPKNKITSFEKLKKKVSKVTDLSEDTIKVKFAKDNEMLTEKDIINTINKEIKNGIIIAEVEIIYSDYQKMIQIKDYQKKLSKAEKIQSDLNSLNKEGGELVTSKLSRGKYLTKQEIVDKLDIELPTIIANVRDKIQEEERKKSEAAKRKTEIAKGELIRRNISIDITSNDDTKMIAVLLTNSACMDENFLNENRRLIESITIRIKNGLKTLDIDITKITQDYRKTIIEQRSMYVEFFIEWFQSDKKKVLNSDKVCLHILCNFILEKCKK